MEDKMREQIGAWSSVGDDLSDAYCHFRLAPEELCHCSAPSREEDKLVIFKAMSFGFKGAPLIMGRLASAPTRQWQAMVQERAHIQTYMDDPLKVNCGTQYWPGCCTRPKPLG